MQFRSWARGEGELYTRKAARGRDARSGELNRKAAAHRQRFYLRKNQKFVFGIKLPAALAPASRVSLKGNGNMLKLRRGGDHFEGEYQKRQDRLFILGLMCLTSLMFTG